MLKGEKGQITVFLSMIFLVMTTIIFCVLEGIHGYMESSLAEEAFQEAGDEILANYHKYLFQKYHVFFLDPREKEYLEEDARNYLKNYMDLSAYYGFSCMELAVTEEKTAVDEKGLFLKYQIGEYMKNKKTIQLGKELQSLIRSSYGVTKAIGENSADFQGEESPSVRAEDSEVQAEEEEETLSPETVRYRACWSDIKKTMEQLLHSGILLYAVDEPGKLSASSVRIGDLPSQKAGKDFSEKDFGVNFSFSSLSQWSSFLKSGSFSGIETMNLEEDAYLLDYLFECCSHYGENNPSRRSKDKTALQYELEYLIGGKHTDRDNLRAVADRILLLRFIINYKYARQSPEVQGKAAVMAGALTGFLGFPEGQKAVTTLLTAAISYGESVLELHTIMNGGKIALVKDASNWNLTFENAAVLLKNKASVKAVKTGIRYEDYLKLLIGLKLQKEFFIYRLMDIMELNASLEEPGFRMEDCLFSFEWHIKLQCPCWFVNSFRKQDQAAPHFSIEMLRFVGY